MEDRVDKRSRHTVVEGVSICELCCPEGEHHHQSRQHHEHRREIVSTTQQRYVFQQPVESHHPSTRSPHRATNNDRVDLANSFEMDPPSINSLPNNTTQGEMMQDLQERPRAIIGQNSSFAPDQTHAAMQAINGSTEGAVLALADSSPAAAIVLRIAQFVANVTATVGSNVSIQTRAMNATQAALALALMGFTIAQYAQDIDCSSDESAQCKAYNVTSWIHTGIAFFTGVGVPLAYHVANPQPAPTPTMPSSSV